MPLSFSLQRELHVIWFFLFDSFTWLWHKRGQGVFVVRELYIESQVAYLHQVDNLLFSAVISAKGVYCTWLLREQVWAWSKMYWACQHPSDVSGFASTQHHPSGLATCEESRCPLSTWQLSYSLLWCVAWCSQMEPLASPAAGLLLGKCVLSEAGVYALPAHPKHGDSYGKVVLPFCSHRGAQP